MSSVSNSRFSPLPVIDPESLLLEDFIQNPNPPPTLNCAQKIRCVFKWSLPTISLISYSTAGVMTIVTIVLSFDEIAKYRSNAIYTDDRSMKPIDGVILVGESLLPSLGASIAATAVTGLKAVQELCKNGCAAAKRAFSESLKPGGLIRDTMLPPWKRMCNVVNVCQGSPPAFPEAELPNLQ